jgi:hypothetical protein
VRVRWVQVPLLRGRNRSARISDADDADASRIMFMDIIVLRVASGDLLSFEVTASCTNPSIVHSSTNSLAEA